MKIYKNYENVTFIRMIKMDVLLECGIILPPSVYSPRGACSIGEVTLIGESKDPIPAKWKVGDYVIFQKVAGRGFPSVFSSDSNLGDTQLYNIDILAILDKDTREINPTYDHVLLKSLEEEFTTESGIILNRKSFTFLTELKAVRCGDSCKHVEPNNMCFVDGISCSILLTDSKGRIQEKFTGGVEQCYIYKESNIMAVSK